MKNIAKIGCLVLVVFCCAGAGPCWLKHQQPVVVQNPMVYGYQYQYVPVIVQERAFVPVVETRVEYRPVVSQFFLNYSHYYVAPSYNYVYTYGGWVRYNY